MLISLESLWIFFFFISQLLAFFLISSGISVTNTVSHLLHPDCALSHYILVLIIFYSVSVLEAWQVSTTLDTAQKLLGIHIVCMISTLKSLLAGMFNSMCLWTRWQARHCF